MENGLRKHRRTRPKPIMSFTSEVPWRGRADDEPMMVGYVRVSTSQQTTQRQVDELVRAGVSPIDIFGDNVSGATMQRDGWEACRKELQPGDMLVIHTLDRLSRDIVDTMQTLRALNDRGVTIKVLTMDFDSRTPIGRFAFAVFAAFAQLERDQGMERTLSGLARARDRGRIGGAQKLYTDKAILEAYAIEGTIPKTAARLRCAEITVKRALARRPKENKNAE